MMTGLQIPPSQKNSFLKYSAVIIITAFLFSACSFSLAQDLKPPAGAQLPTKKPDPTPDNTIYYPLVHPDPLNGKLIYTSKCAPCHGITGKGDGERANQISSSVPPIGSYEYASKALLSDWFKIVTNGNLEKLMPPFESLSERERWDVLAYVFSMNGSVEDITAGKSIYVENCQECHGEYLEGKVLSTDQVQVTSADLTSLEYQARVSSEYILNKISDGTHAGMPGFINVLPEIERKQVVDFIRSNFTRTPPLEQPQSSDGETDTTSPDSPTEVTGDEVITGTIKVTGVITNGSGVDVPGDLIINLHGFVGVENTLTLSTTIKADQTFAFEGVQSPDNLVLLTTATYKGIRYSSNFEQVDSSLDEIKLPITIYETTDDLTWITGDILHLFMQFTPDNTLMVSEVLELTNTSNRVFVPFEDGTPAIEFQLPDQAFNLNIPDENLAQEIVITNDGIGYGNIIGPSSTKQFYFSFELPYEGEYQFSQSMTLPARRVMIVVPKDGMDFKGANFIKEDHTDDPNMQFISYTSGGVQVGDKLEFSITGKSRSLQSQVLNERPDSLIIGAFALGFVLIVVGFMLYSRYRETRLIPAKMGSSHTSHGDAESVMDAILTLDDLFQAGQINEDAYRRRRSEMKEQLKKVV